MEEERTKNYVNGEENEAEIVKDEDKLALQFLDSLHNYLSLTHSLSSTLRQVKKLHFNLINSNSIIIIVTKLNPCISLI